MQTRIAALLDHLGWLQKDLAAYLSVDRTVVSRMANGQPEPGPVSKLLDLLATERGRADLTAAVWAEARAARPEPASAPDPADEPSAARPVPLPESAA